MIKERRVIDLNNYTESDLLFDIVYGESLVIQVDGDANINVKGKQTEAENYASIGLLSLADFTTKTSITSSGLYSCDVQCIDKIKLEVEKADSKVYVKVVSS